MFITKRYMGIKVSELARYYFPRSTKRSAVTQFQRWRKINKPLQNRLRELGYKPYQREFTALQYEAVLELMGDP